MTTTEHNSPENSLGSQFMLTSTVPRALPWSVRFRLLFGGELNQIGWGFLSLGIIYATFYLAMFGLPDSIYKAFRWLPAIIGLSMIILGTVRGNRRCKLVTRGIAVCGKRVRTRRTGLSINKRTLYRLTVEFNTGNHIETCDVHVFGDKVTDAASDEIVLFDPHHIDQAETLTSLSEQLRCDEYGNIQSSGMSTILWTMAFPSLALLSIVGVLVVLATHLRFG